MADPIQVTVIGGYLGAGKTTLVNHILRSSDERIGVLLNDFGSIAIDEDLIVAADEDKITLANGCICCSLVDGFATALDTIRSAAEPPSRLLIEASGVADPATVAAYGQVPGLALDAVIAIADADTVRAKAADPYVGDVVRQQLENADLIVLNKVDLVDDGQVAELRAWLGQTAGGALVVEAVHAAVSPSALVGVPARDRTDTLAAPEAASDVFDSRSYTWSEPLQRSALEDALSALPDEVVRVKGVVRFADAPEQRFVVHRVGRRQAIEAAGTWKGGRSRLVVIGLRGSSWPEFSAPTPTR